MILETNFQLIFNVENNYKDAGKILDEIMRIQNIVQTPRFNLGCSTFYLAIIKFSKNILK